MKSILALIKATTISTGLFLATQGVSLAQETSDDSVESNGEMSIADRHMIMIQPGVDQVIGSYMFGVKNPSTKPQTFSFELFLPKETLDFGPQDGLKKEDLQLNSEGKVIVSKEFAPGLNILSVGFMAKVDPSEQSISFNSSYDLQELSFLTNDPAVSLKADGLEEGVPSMLTGNRFKGIISNKVIQSGKKVVVSILGLPKGRADFQTTGILFGAILVVFAGLLTVVKKTKTNYTSEVDEVIEL